MQQDHRPGSTGNSGPGFNPVALVLESFAFSVAVFLRRRFGERYVYLQGPCAVLLILLFAGSSQEPLPVLGFLVAYLFMCLCNQNSVRFGQLSGVPKEHTRYSGWPRVMRFLPGWSEVTVKQYVEPVIVALAGTAAMYVNPALGAYLLIAAFCLGGSTMLSESHHYKQAIDMHDAVIEAQQRAERFRSFRGDR